MTNNFETIMVAAFSGGLLTMIGKWLFGKRAAKVDVLQKEVTAMHGIIESWKLLNDAFKLRVTDLEGLVMQYREENRLLKIQVGKLTEQVKRIR